MKAKFIFVILVTMTIMSSFSVNAAPYVLIAHEVPFDGDQRGEIFDAVDLEDGLEFVFRDGVMFLSKATYEEYDQIDVEYFKRITFSGIDDRKFYLTLFIEEFFPIKIYLDQIIDFCYVPFHEISPRPMIQISIGNNYLFDPYGDVTTITFREEIEGGTSISQTKAKNENRVFYLDGNLVIESSAPLGEVVVYSVTGSVVKTFKTSENALSVDLGLPKGLYIVKFGTNTAKILVP